MFVVVILTITFAFCNKSIDKSHSTYHEYYPMKHKKLKYIFSNVRLWVNTRMVKLINITNYINKTYQVEKTNDATNNHSLHNGDIINEMKKRWIILLAFIITCVPVISCSSSTSEPGILHGEVKIGPLVPVEQEGVTYEVPCEVYDLRKIMIYKENGSDLVKEVDIDCDGRYRVELSPGTYIVDINHIGIDTSSDVPSKVEIISQQTTRLDIDIDTGIR